MAFSGKHLFETQYLSHNTFTVKVEYGSYKTSDTGYFNTIYLTYLELPSRERVAASVNYDSTQLDDNRDYYIMPVGKVVEADLSKDITFLKQVQKHDIKSGAALISFFIFHIIGVKLNFFPRFIPRRKRTQ